MKRFKISLLPVMLVGAYVLIEGSFDPLWLIGCSLLHELGHMAAIRLLGGRVRSLSGGGQGFALSVNGLSYKGELLAALAGPVASLLLALLFGLAEQWFFCFANGAYALLNLLPIMPLDGGRVLRAILALHCSPSRRQQVLEITGLAFLLPLLGLSFWQFLSSGYNISLLFVSIYLLSLIKENGYDV